MRSREIAKGGAAIWKPSMLTGTSATSKSWAIGPICAAAIRPPAATITNVAYITQKTGLRTASRGERSNWDWGQAQGLALRRRPHRGLAQEEGEQDHDAALDQPE